MSAVELLDQLTLHGVTLKADGTKLMFSPTDRVSPDLKMKLREHKQELLTLLQSDRPDRLLAHVYRKYWMTPEKADMATFKSILAEIATLEAQLDPGRVIDILETEARKFHQATGTCPYCQLEGPLHQEPTGHDGGRR